ncbi:MAG: hypothetical protein JO100_16225 [Pseudonocardia sp.]|nr:hypothetical protein [Pseudonocardia sp.]
MPKRPLDMPDAARRRRLAEIFGEVLPGATGDDVELDVEESAEARARRWHLENRPPHH